MIPWIIYCILCYSILTLRSLRCLPLFIILIYRINGLGIYQESSLGGGSYRIWNHSRKAFSTPFIGTKRSHTHYSFINSPHVTDYSAFKLEAAKAKASPGKAKTAPKKAVPKIRPPSKNAAKKSTKKMSKSELGMMKARAKAKAKMKAQKQKKLQIFGRGKVTLEEEDKEEVEKEYQRRIAVVDTASYTEKISMDTLLDESRPYMALFNSEKITKDDLVGFDMPYGLVPQERYELWKLCGRVSDPSVPFTSQSLTTKMFTQRLFGKEYEINRDDFNYKIEYKMKFYAPGYGEIFFMDKIRCWRAYHLVRDYKYGPEDLPTYTSIYPIARPEDNVPISQVMLAVNAEINRQGVHPAVLDMFWNFFTDDPQVLTRDLVTYKLNWITERLDDRDPGEGISPDNFYRVFYEPTKEALHTFDKEAFLRKQLANLHEMETHKMLMMNNKALRVRNKMLKEAYNEDLKQLYKTPVPRTYTRYERARLAGYFNMLHHMYEMRERGKQYPKKEPTAEAAPKTQHELLLEREIEKCTLQERRQREMKRRKDLRKRKKKKKAVDVTSVK